MLQHNTGTLHQRYEERKMRTFHDRMLTFPQPCLKIVKKFNNKPNIFEHALRVL